MPASFGVGLLQPPPWQSIHGHKDMLGDVFFEEDGFMEVEGTP